MAQIQQIPHGMHPGGRTHLIDTARVPGAHSKLLCQPHGRVMEVYTPAGRKHDHGHAIHPLGGLQGRSTIQPPYVISWTLSCCFLFSRSVSRQRRKFSSVSSALRLTVILSLLLHTSKPVKATRKPRG